MLTKLHVSNSWSRVFLVGLHAYVDHKKQAASVDCGDVPCLPDICLVNEFKQTHVLPVDENYKKNVTLEHILNNQSYRLLQATARTQAFCVQKHVINFFHTIIIIQYLHRRPYRVIPQKQNAFKLELHGD